MEADSSNEQTRLGAEKKIAKMLCLKYRSIRIGDLEAAKVSEKLSGGFSDVVLEENEQIRSTK